MMAQPEIQYVRYYSYGSEAQKIEPKIAPRKPQPKRQPRPVQQKKLVLQVDLLAAFGTLLAVVMLVMMVAGVVKLNQVNQQAVQMQQYVASLQEENKELEDTYHAGYDLAEIEKQALALGMVPRDQAQQIQIQVQIPQQTAEESTWWENVYSFLTGLFA